MRVVTTIARHQRGATLFESLVAFVVLAFGALAVAPLQGELRLQGDAARQRTEAVRLGAQELETLRAFSAIAAASAVAAYEAIVDAQHTVDGASGFAGNTAYRVDRRIADAAFGAAKSATVAVQWTDRSGAAQRIALETLIAGHDPAYSGTLALGAGVGRPRGVAGRSPAIPAGATPLGDGRSAWKPVPSAGTVLVFDDTNGSVVARCSGIAAAARELSAASLAGCESGRWLLLAGTIRSTLAAPPRAAEARDSAPALAVRLDLTGGSYPSPAACSVDAMQVVRLGTPPSTRLEAVSAGATPASHGVADWLDTGDRFTAYRCLVPLRGDGRWSGRTVVVPDGWTIGGGASERKVCRFASDRDASGAIDANLEHPADYADVAATLTAQNFLIVRGDQSCPSAPGAGIVEALLGTMQHQP